MTSHNSTLINLSIYIMMQF